jgi:hypothetical protein
MKLIPTKQISPLINRCYMEYDPNWPTDQNQRISAFKYYIERTAGLKLDFEPKIDQLTFKQGYELHSVEVVDDKKYMLFVMRYSS